MKRIIALLVTITINVSVCDARILNVPEDYQTIQAGIDSSSEGDTVLVETGIYRENVQYRGIGVTLSSRFILDGRVGLRDSTIIDGGATGPAVTFEQEEDSTAILCGVTVQGRSGKEVIDQNRTFHFGAGIYCYDSSPTITNCKFTADSLGEENSFGGGIYLADSYARIVECRFVQNFAFSSGGGIYASNCSLLVVRCYFRRNLATEAGMAFYGENSVLIIRGTDFQGHVPDASTVSFVGISGIVDDCIFTGGMFGLRLTGRSQGLVIYNSDFDVGFISNVLCESNGVEFIKCRLVGRSAIIAGVGAAFEQCVIDVVEVISGEALLRNCIVKGTAFLKHGAGLTAINTISRGGSFAVFSGSDAPNRLTVSYSNIINGLEGIETNDNGEVDWLEGNIDVDPMFIDQHHNNFHLSANSPCIDAGDPEAPLDPDGTRADIGAFYFHQRDIAIAPAEIHFAPIPFGVLDSLPLTISNTGGNDLLFCIPPTLEASCIWMRQMENQDTLTLPAFQDTVLWVLFHPEEGAPMHRWIMIESNDPDEPEISIEATGEVNAVTADNLHASIFTIHSAYPNPFNGQTTIRFSTGPINREATLRVYGLDGRLVKELWTGGDAYPTEERQAGRLSYAGEHSVIWNAEGLPGGVYLIRLEAGKDVRTMKAILLR